MSAILLPDSLLARQAARRNQSVINCVRRQTEWQQKSSPGTPDTLGLSANVERGHAEASLPRLAKAEAPGLRPDGRQQRKGRVLRLDQGNRLVRGIASSDEDAPGREQSSIVDRVAYHDKFQRQPPIRGILCAVEYHLIAFLDTDRAYDADTARIRRIRERRLAKCRIVGVRLHCRMHGGEMPTDASSGIFGGCNDAPRPRHQPR